ncbi:major capsid protein [Metasolibacillus meyeri]|uniref:Major capsid protein n=1 Tax=Metasolibacillus meyeri TaxID=1071052 RepID=A0AAW9NQN7_9BACL|nr:major capsid protein [Metasolibacillus meyeri]MEC1177624.1 major capsid protein [Metasolibacillus meyeri]
MTTKIIDVIQPEVFTEYTIQRTMELSALIQSGIAQNTSEFDTLASGPNTLINMPYWDDLTGEPEVMNDKDDTVPGKITANKDVARKMAWVKSYGANALSAMLSGDDPMRAIGDLFSAYWARQYQQMLLSILDGIFSATNMASKVHDITSLTGGDQYINGSSFIDAVQVMGDAKDSLTGIMMHSAVEADLAKKNLIEYIQDSQGSVRVPYFMNKRVVVDDAMAFDTTTKAATAYLFGEGAIAWGNGSHPDIQQAEVVRKGLSLAGEDILVNRRLPLLHPRGVKWTEDTVAETFPTFEELETGDNWERVYDPKAIRIVKFDFLTGTE